MRGKCARVLAEAGQIADALELYAQIGDVEALKRLIIAHANALCRAGQCQALAEWIALVPPREIEADGWLLHWHAMVVMSSSPLEAQRRFTRAYEKFRKDEDQPGQFLAAIGAIEAVLARVDRYGDLDEWIRALEPQMNRAEEIGDAAVRARAWYAFLQSTLLRRPDHPLIPTGIAWLRKSLLEERFSPAETVSAGAVLMFYACLAADDTVAQETATLSGKAAHRDDLAPVARWTWHYWYGLFWLWRLEYEHAVQCWEHCTRISEQSGLTALDWLVHGNLVMVDLAEDRLDQAERRMAELRRAGAAGHMNAYALYWMAETFLRLYRQRSDLPEAIKAMVECARITGFFNLEMLCLSDAAAVHLLRGEDDAAAALVNEVGARVAGTVVKQSDGQVVALRAGLLYRAGRIEEAHRTFVQALDLVARGGSCGCMLWVRAGLSTLFGAALQVSRHVPLVRDLVRRYQVPAPARAGEEWPWPVRIHSLGQFRIEVDDAPIPFGRKAQQKVLELLKVLIAEGAKEVDGGMVADWLWPDVDGDAAQSNLRGTVKRLRELLGHTESVRLFDGKISLNERICWLDLWAFREWCAALMDGAVVNIQHAETTRQVQTLYQGPLLNGEDAPWLQPARRRERQRLGRVLARLSTHDESVASRLRDHALLVDPELAAA
jgi:LuxR family transcriptional regulator, maltose regulon positive regulatory protein